MTNSDTSKTKAAKKKVSKKKTAKRPVATKQVAKKVSTKKAVTKKAASKTTAKKAAPARAKKPTISIDEKRMMIAVHAYYKWQKAGCPTGDDFNHWLEAEKEIEDMIK